MSHPQINATSSKPARIAQSVKRSPAKTQVMVLIPDNLPSAGHGLWRVGLALKRSAGVEPEVDLRECTVCSPSHCKQDSQFSEIQITTISDLNIDQE